MAESLAGSPDRILAKNPKTIEEFWELILPDRCTGCQLHTQRNTIVPNRGSGLNGIMIVGQNPGADEDKEGMPFIGRAGMELDKQFELADINPEACWITNACKCHSTVPRVNATPTREYLLTCRKLLKAEINLVKPDVIVTAGLPATKSVLNDFNVPPMRRMVGEIQEAQDLNCAVIPMYHPSYLMRGRQGEGDFEYDACICALKLAKAVAETERKSRDDN